MAEPEAAVAIVHAREPEESVLLIRRTERAGDPWSGHWSFPGGRRDPEDPDLLHTALRELEEECGVRLTRQVGAEPLSPAVARRRTGPFVLVAPFVFRVPGVLPAVPDLREAAETLWIPLRILVDPAQHALRPVPGRPAHMRFPAIALNGAPLWGFTYRLITDWLGLLGKDPAPERAAFDTASLLLEFLIARGLPLECPWRDASPGEATVIEQPVKVASVRGTIPVGAVLDHFSLPGRHVPPINLLEVRENFARVIGLEFEEYRIDAMPRV